MKLVIVSRDGVINKRVDGGVTHRTQLHLIDSSIHAIAELYQQGYTVVMVTHQPGLSRGLFDLDELEAMHSKITEAVEQSGGTIHAVFYCPHDKADGCYCHPPAMGLLDVIEIELDTTVQGVWYFCDNAIEAEMAENKQCIPIVCASEFLLKDAIKTLSAE